MNVIHRDIYVTRHQRIQPIDIVRGCQVGIELQLMDYEIPSGASAKAYAREKNVPNTYESKCTISGNTVSFTPEDGFFIPGTNRLQIEINGVIIPFSIDVICEPRISDGGDAATPEQVRPMVERAELAASSAEKAASKAAEEASAAVAPLVQQAQEAESGATQALEKIKTSYPDVGKLLERLTSGKIEDAELHLGFYIDADGDLCQKEES